MADWRPLLFQNFFAHNFKTNRDRDFVFVSKKGFWGMASLVVVFPVMSDSKWPTGSHFVFAFSTFLLITSKPIEIESSVFVSKKEFLGIASLVVIFLMMSDSNWPTGGHFCSTSSTFSLITSKPIEKRGIGSYTAQ